MHVLCFRKGCRLYLRGRSLISLFSRILKPHPIWICVRSVLILQYLSAQKNDNILAYMVLLIQSKPVISGLYPPSYIPATTERQSVQKRLSQSGGLSFYLCFLKA